MAQLTTFSNYYQLQSRRWLCASKQNYWQSPSIIVSCSLYLIRGIKGETIKFCNQIWHYNTIDTMNEYIELGETKTMGKGIFAKMDIPANTVIVRIEEEEYITYQRIITHPLFNSLQSQLANNKLVFFAFFLAYCELQSNPTTLEAQIKDYLKKLPERFNNLICWSSSELKNIRNSILVEKIQRRKSEIWEEYIKLQEYTQSRLKCLNQQSEQTDDSNQSKCTTRKRTKECSRFTPIISRSHYELLKRINYQQVLKYISAVQSRNIYYQSFYDCNSQVGALIPFLQFFNHHPNAQCEVQQSTTSEKVITVREIKKGEQVFVNYGKSIGADQFLEYYGMVPLAIQPQKQFQCDKQNAKDTGNSSQRKRLAEIYNTIYQKKMGKWALIKNPRIGQN